MRYWWVNQNRTYRHEVLREVAPGDVVFSFADTIIKAIGIVRSHGYEAPKPIEFGQAGAYWETIGWRVDVRIVELLPRYRSLSRRAPTGQPLQAMAPRDQ